MSPFDKHQAVPRSDVLHLLLRSVCHIVERAGGAPVPFNTGMLAHRAQSLNVYLNCEQNVYG